ncbi:MAG: hypothetical protein WDN45_16460 [Caulobacteraceae bacterium]
MEWGKDGAERDFYAYDSSLGYDANFDREPGSNPDAPYAVDSASIEGPWSSSCRTRAQASHC